MRHSSVTGIATGIAGCGGIVATGAGVATGGRGVLRCPTGGKASCGAVATGWGMGGAGSGCTGTGFAATTGAGFSTGGFGGIGSTFSGSFTGTGTTGITATTGAGVLAGSTGAGVGVLTAGVTAVVRESFKNQPPIAAAETHTTAIPAQSGVRFFGARSAGVGTGWRARTGAGGTLLWRGTGAMVV